jgi:hypothetical protein
VCVTCSVRDAMQVLTPEETLAIQKQRKFQLWVGVIGFLSIVPVFFAMPYVVEGVLYVMRERGTLFLLQRGLSLRDQLTGVCSALFEADLDR